MVMTELKPVANGGWVGGDTLYHPPHMTQLIVGPFPWTFVGPFAAERSELCSERSDEVRDCKVLITQTKDCKSHRLNLTLNTY